MTIDEAAIAAVLRRLDAKPGPMLVHSDLRRCLGLRGRSRDEKLETLLRGLENAVGDGPLLVPAYTYSYCRGEDFDPARSPSMVGAFGEWLRGQPGSRRTTDPIYSIVVRGTLPPAWEQRLFSTGDSDCFGPDSGFAYLREADAQILFFGVAATANTFVHHLEQILGVGYRYLKDFTGRVMTPTGATPTRASMFVRDLASDVEVYFVPLVEALLREGGAKAGQIEGGPALVLTSACAVERCVRREIAANPDFLLRRGHPRALAA